jgi:hypothetical protein
VGAEARAFAWADIRRASAAGLSCVATVTRDLISARPNGHKSEYGHGGSVERGLSHNLCGRTRCDVTVVTCSWQRGAGQSWMLIAFWRCSRFARERHRGDEFVSERPRGRASARAHGISVKRTCCELRHACSVIVVECGSQARGRTSVSARAVMAALQDAGTCYRFCERHVVTSPR